MGLDAYALSVMRPKWSENLNAGIDTMLKPTAIENSCKELLTRATKTLCEELYSFLLENT